MVIKLDDVSNFHLNINGQLVSPPMVINCLGIGNRSFNLSDFTLDDNKSDYIIAMNNLLSLNSIHSPKVNDALYRFYLDNSHCGLKIVKSNIWNYLSIGNSVTVSRRDMDKMIYMSIESECEWEIEHGLEIVIKDGLNVVKIGEYDGHLTNADAYNNSDFENMVYVTHKMVVENSRKIPVEETPRQKISEVLNKIWDRYSSEELRQTNISLIRTRVSTTGAIDTINAYRNNYRDLKDNVWCIGGERMVFLISRLLDLSYSESL